MFDPRAVANHGVGTDVHELVHQREAAHDDMVFDVDVAGEGDVVGNGGVVANDAVMREVDVGHDPVVVAEDGGADVLHGAPVEGGVFADGVVVADLQGGRFAAVFFVLRRSAQRGKGVDVVVFADAGRAFDDDVRGDGGAAVNVHVCADDAVCTDIDVWREFGLGVDDGGWVDHVYPPLPAVVHMISASQTSLSSTCASALNDQMPRRERIMLMSKCSWSPGTTVLRKRALSMPTKK